MDKLEAIGIARKALFDRGNMLLDERARRMVAAPSDGVSLATAEREVAAYNILAALKA